MACAASWTHPGPGSYTEPWDAGQASRQGMKRGEVVARGDQGVR